MAENELNPALESFLNQVGAPLTLKTELAKGTQEEQAKHLNILTELFVAGQLQKHLAIKSAELKQAKESLACLNRELKRVKKRLSYQADEAYRSEKNRDKLIRAQDQEIERLKTNQKVKRNAENEILKLMRENEREKLRPHLGTPSLGHQYDELLARLATFNQGTKNSKKVSEAGVTPVRIMCSRLKTETKKLGKHLAGAKKPRKGQGFFSKIVG